MSVPDNVVLTTKSNLTPYFSDGKTYHLKSNPSVTFNSEEELKQYIVSNPDYKITMEIPSDETARIQLQRPISRLEEYKQPKLPYISVPTYIPQATIGPPTPDYRTPYQKAQDEYYKNHWQEIKNQQKAEHYLNKGASFLLGLVSPTNWYGWINGGDFADNKGIWETNSEMKGFYDNYPVLATLLNIGADAMVYGGSAKALKPKSAKVTTASGIGRPSYISYGSTQGITPMGQQMIRESERRLLELQNNIDQIVKEGSEYIKIHGGDPSKWEKATRSIKLDYNILNNPDYINRYGDLTSQQVQQIVNNRFNTSVTLNRTDVASSMKGRFYTGPYADAFPHPTADPLVYVTHEFAHYTNPRVPVNAPGFNSSALSEEVLAIGSQIKSWVGKSKITVDDFKNAQRSMANQLKENINLNKFFYIVRQKAAVDPDYYSKIVKYINLFSRMIIPGMVIGNTDQ